MVGDLPAKTTDGLIARYINRRISTALTKLILSKNLPITPNQVSVISFVVSLVSAAAFALGYPILGGISAQISSIVDGVDGELARARKIVSKVGAFLDSMLDRYADVLIIISASLYIQRSFAGLWSSVLPLIAVSGDLLVSYIHVRGQYDLGVHPLLVKPTIPIASRDVRLFLIMLGGILEHLVPGALTYSVIVLACVSHFYVALKFLVTVVMASRGIL